MDVTTPKLYFCANDIQAKPWKFVKWTTSIILAFEKHKNSHLYNLYIFYMLQ